MLFECPNEPHVVELGWPTRVILGAGALGRVPQALYQLGARRPLLVTDAGVARVGLAHRLADVLKRARVQVAVFDRVRADPTEEDVQAAAEEYDDGRCDAVLALGGGSALDVAKMLRVAVAHEGPLERYDPKDPDDPGIPPDLPPMIAVPTTAGTGSEVSPAAVVLLEGRERKTAFSSRHLVPSVAVCDPELTFGLPRTLTAWTGMDAFAHCLEAWVAKGFHPFADAAALDGIARVSRSLGTVLKEPNHLAARTEMMVAAIEGAMALSKGLGAAHALAHALTAVQGVHHGLGKGVLLPWVMEFNRPAIAQRLARVAVALGEASNLREDVLAGLATERVRRLRKDAGIPDRLRDVGVREADLPRIARLAFADSAHRTNPRRCREADLLGIARAAY